MASGPEHWAKAERLLEGYAEAHRKIEAAQPFDSVPAYEDARLTAMLAQGLLLKAQVHAELAKAAATLETVWRMHPDAFQAWHRVLSDDATI